jgi:hypothetical protein
MTNPPARDVGAAGFPGDAEFDAAPNFRFPYAYLEGFSRFLHEHQDRIRVITFADLEFAPGDDYRDHYAAEFSRWKSKVRNTPWMQRTVFVLLQYDVDHLPEQTVRLMSDQAKLGLRTNAMIFHRRISRRWYERHGEFRELPYALDRNQLARLQAQGCVVGYHNNAYDRSGLDPARAAEIFAGDVAALRQDFHIRFFSPHGGIRDAEGRSNSAIEPSPALRDSLIWVQNRFGLRFDDQFSDGGLNHSKRDLRRLDLIDFVSHWRPGRRYRVLLHPQYYGDPVSPAPRLCGLRWYDRLLQAYAEPANGTDPWRQAKMGTSISRHLFHRFLNVIQRRR